MSNTSHLILSFCVLVIFSFGHMAVANESNEETPDEIISSADIKHPTTAKNRAPAQEYSRTARIERVAFGRNHIEFYKIIDGPSTCYSVISSTGNSISCVKE